MLNSKPKYDIQGSIGAKYGRLLEEMYCKKPFSWGSSITWVIIVNLIQNECVSFNLM
jgi:hypothetical protein